jgi:cell division protein FtsB
MPTGQEQFGSTVSAPRRIDRRALKWIIVLFGVLLVADATVGERGLVAVLSARRQFLVLEQSLSQARSENARLRKEIRHLLVNPSAIEDLARRELGMIKPGERLFIIADGDARKPSQGVRDRQH